MTFQQRNRPQPPTPVAVPKQHAFDGDESDEGLPDLDGPPLPADIEVLSDTLVCEPDSSSREERIARTAYRLAEQRGFESGHELEDWLQAEKKIDGG